MTEASAWINRDFTKARAAAKIAIEKATARGDPAIVSRTYGILCQQQPSINASEEAISDCQNAMEESIAAKDANGEAMMRTDLAAVYYLRGELAKSARMFQQAVNGFRQVGNRDGVATALSNFADTRFAQGDLMGARKLLERSIPEYQAVDDKEGVVLNLESLGDMWRQNGELDRAATAYQQAEEISRKIDDKRARGYVLSGKGDLALDRGDLALARTFYEQALDLRNQTGERQIAEETRVSLAKLAIEEGHGSDAEAAARMAQRGFHQDQEMDDELNASTVLITALLIQRKQGEAEKEVQRANQLSQQSQNRFLRMEFELISARVLLESDHPKMSAPLFQQIDRDAKRYGFVGLGFANELALANLASKTKDSARAQTRLLALQKAAGAKGFGLIALKALSESRLLEAHQL
jgi:tetratricopeptide (TPR) repeat protein